MVEDLNDTAVYPRVKAILQSVAYKTLSLDNVTPETRLLEDLGLDSARLVDLVLNLEDEFGISIEDDLIDKIKTVGDLTTLIKEKSGR